MEQVKPTSIMKKIMFDDRYGLTEAVLEKRKTMTRRVERIDFYPGSTEEQIEKFCKRRVTDTKGRQVWEGFDNKGNWIAQLISHYAIGEEVAVAQSYGSIVEQDPENDYGDYYVKQFRYAPGWTNKMFVRADLMPHRIRIINIRVERLQDISDEDCAREGIVPVVFRQWHKQALTDFSPQKYTDHRVWTLEKFRDGIEDPWEGSEPGEYMAETAQVAFAVLINKISGKGTWERNPWVFVYEFELVK